MKLAVSDLLFPGFTKAALRDLSPEYGIEFFYEFGKDYYWNSETAAWGGRELSIHGPCVAVNLVDRQQKNYLKLYQKAFAYAYKCGARFVVVHTNEAYSGERQRVQALVIRRLRRLAALAEKCGVQMVVENVGLRTKGNVLFDLNEYLALIDILADSGVKALLDTGHAHVNGWDIAAAVRQLGGRLIACHVHDNDGGSDAHLPVGQGTTDWPEFFGTVKKYAPDAALVLEYCCGFATAADLESHIKRLQKQYKL